MPVARLRQSERVLSRTVGAETFLSLPERDGVDVLSESASAVWRMLATPRSHAEILGLVNEAYGTGPEAEQGIVELLRSLKDRGLLHDESDSHA